MLCIFTVANYNHKIFLIHSDKDYFKIKHKSEYSAFCEQKFKCTGTEDIIAGMAKWPLLYTTRASDALHSWYCSIISRTILYHYG